LLVNLEDLESGQIDKLEDCMDVNKPVENKKKRWLMPTGKIAGFLDKP
jgi:hypothetical protein